MHKNNFKSCMKKLKLIFDRCNQAIGLPFSKEAPVFFSHKCSQIAHFMPHYVTVEMAHLNDKQTCA